MCMDLKDCRTKINYKSVFHEHFEIFSYTEKDIHFLSESIKSVMLPLWLKYGNLHYICSFFIPSFIIQLCWIFSTYFEDFQCVIIFASIIQPNFKNLKKHFKQKSILFNHIFSSISSLVVAGKYFFHHSFLLWRVL